MQRRTNRTMASSRWLVTVVLSVLALLITACGGAATPATTPAGGTSAGNGQAAPTAAPAASGEPVEIVFAVNVANDQRTGWNDLVDTANKELAAKNITIVMQNTATTSWPEYYQKVTAQMAAGKSPDIGRIAESFMPTLIDKNQVVDLSSYLGQLDMSQYYENTFKNAGFRDGKNYGLPSGVFYMVMYYNKNLFDQAGLPYPSGDWTKASSFAEVQEAAKKLTSGDGDSKTWGFYGGPYMAFIGMYAQSNGGKNVLNEDNTCALTEPAAVEVYKWFDDMMKTDKTMPTPTDLSVVGPGDLFLGGKLAMTVDGTWFLPQVLEKAKDFEVGIAAVPAGKGEAFSSQFVDNWVIWKGTKHEAEAWEALKALYSAAGWQTLAASGEAGIPVHRATTSKLLEETISGQLGAENKTAFEEALNHTVSVPYNSFYEEVDQLANNTMDEWRLGQITYQQYAEKVCGFINEAAAQTK
jgi:multiple sugar transport system substrate-binding protein